SSPKTSAAWAWLETGSVGNSSASARRAAVCQRRRLTMIMANIPARASSESGSRPFATVNPFTSEKVREFPFLGDDEIDDIVDRAHRAFRSWRQRPVSERARVVRRAGDLMLERKDTLAALITLEMGKLIGESHWEVGLA